MKLVPTGIENFKEIIDGNYYYIDKTDFILDVLKEKVVLYTRPRRFGKTLNMSMLYYFFSNRESENHYLFEHLSISNHTFAIKYQNQYPTLFLSLKDMKGYNSDDQYYNFSSCIARLLDQFEDILNAPVFNERERLLLNKYHMAQASKQELKDALLNISSCLYKYYKQKVIILIDEYDVPLQSAYQNNYYEEMVDFFRSVFSSALKTNPALEKAVLTGCLRISKESIFTGLNNFTTYSILDNIANESFGFTEKEIIKILEDYHLSSFMNEVKEWYDGYQFGNLEIYNPWSTLMYVKYKTRDFEFQPIPFWANTSGNDLVLKYIKTGSQQLKQEFELLVRHQSVIKEIKPELTYREMDDINNIYSFLLLTGYLKIGKQISANCYELIIPNHEVYEIYKQSFITYFNDYTSTKKDYLYHELCCGNTYRVNELLNDILMKDISFYDNLESFYHGFLLGLLSDYNVKSNREAGNGRFDLCVFPNSILDTAILIECKHSDSAASLKKDAHEGIQQIQEKQYVNEVVNSGYDNVICYGISFYQKQCYVEKMQ